MTKNRRSNKQFGWPRAIRDIFVSAINKGQLPILSVSVMFFIILIRLPEKDITRIVSAIIRHLVNYELIAYIIIIIICTLWFISSKIQRANHTAEMNRCAEEKTKLQNKLAKKQFKSSNT